MLLRLEPQGNTNRCFDEIAQVMKILWKLVWRISVGERRIIDQFFHIFEQNFLHDWLFWCIKSVFNQFIKHFTFFGVNITQKTEWQSTNLTTGEGKEWSLKSFLLPSCVSSSVDLCTVQITHRDGNIICRSFCATSETGSIGWICYCGLWTLERGHRSLFWCSCG